MCCSGVPVGVSPRARPARGPRLRALGRRRRGDRARLRGAVEVGQILAPTRTAAALDVLAQVAGALAGALAAHGLGAAARAGRGPGRRPRGRGPPSSSWRVSRLVLAADALYPYALTLDVSTAWGNLKRAQLAPLASFGRRFWGDILVDRSASPMPRWWLAGSLAVPRSARSSPGSRHRAGRRPRSGEALHRRAGTERGQRHPGRGGRPAGPRRPLRP